MIIYFAVRGITMKEVKTSKGLLKFNRNTAIICGGTFILMGAGIATGTLIEAEKEILYLSGAGIASCSLFSFDIAAKAHKQLKKTK